MQQNPTDDETSNESIGEDQEQAERVMEFLLSSDDIEFIKEYYALDDDDLSKTGEAEVYNSLVEFAIEFHSVDLASNRERLMI
ncbi:hypothetical protein [Paenibacillus sp. yr247]|uniref:hypothetical protein n=1 Tax=Paenibacillus sp. yr247 TaxID=1761880 RepID=UPI0020C9263C|nr:hypothetical protein [Paenibacillus sp. yr247]